MPSPLTLTVQRPTVEIRLGTLPGGQSTGSAAQEPRTTYWCDPSQDADESARRHPSVLECVEAGVDALPEGSTIDVQLVAYIDGVPIETQTFDLADSPAGYYPIRIIGGDRGYSTYFILSGVQGPESGGSSLTVQNCLVLLNTGDHIISTNSALRFEDCVLDVYQGHQPCYMTTEGGYFEIVGCTFSPHEEEYGCSFHFTLGDVEEDYGSTLHIEDSSLYTQTYESLAGAGGPAATVSVMSQIEILGTVSWRFLNNSVDDATFLSGDGLVSLRGTLRVDVKSESATVTFASPGIQWGSDEFGNPGGSIEISLSLGEFGELDASSIAGLPITWLQTTLVTIVGEDEPDRRIVAHERFIDVDSSAGDCSPQLPNPIYYPGLILTFRRTSASNSVVLDAASRGGTIGGAASYTLAADAFSTVEVQSDGADWIVIGGSLSGAPPSGSSGFSAQLGYMGW